MSSLDRVKQALIVLVLLSVLVVYAVHAAPADDEDLVDPTQPLVFGVPAAQQEDKGSFFKDLQTAMQTYELNSVLIRSKDRIAVINKQRVRVGDMVGEAKVVNIEANSVTIEVNGISRELRLYNGSVKTLAGGDG